MALLLDILKWTEESLSPWQRDAVRRLFQTAGGLSQEDFDCLYQLLKAEYGLPMPMLITAVPLTVNHLPSALAIGETMVLKTIRDLKNVNRIAGNQSLHLAPLGMSVIYGGNGSGKSGYVRVMKQACRARDQGEYIHPDATDIDAQDLVPEAVFDVELNGLSKSVQWSRNEDAPDELATVAVFDAHCARAYLTAENDVAYLPYGLDVLERLANDVISEIKGRLEAEIATINVDPQPFQHLMGETKVGQVISSLSGNTDVAVVKALAELTELEKKRLTELSTALAEGDPGLRAEELRRSAARFKQLASRIESVADWVSEAAVNRLIAVDNDAVAAYRAEKLAALALQSGEVLLPGTGEQVWKAMFDAARKFSTETAYPDHTFPHVGDAAVCPLCQQSLKNEGERLARFEKYIQDDVAKVAAQQRRMLQAAKERITSADLGIGLDESLIGELTSLNETVVSTTLLFHETIKRRRDWVLGALETHKWQDIPGFEESPRSILRTLSVRQLLSARTFARAVDEEKKKALAQELAELAAREKLAASLEGVLALIGQIQIRDSLTKCEKGLKTKPISDKSKEFASNAVTNTLKTSLDEEFRAVGIGHLKTKLKARNQKGVIKHQLILDLPTSNRLEQILSEGEQRAMALGAFLAELRLANHSGAIVFDDPVSSLDHKRRGFFAKRLAKESVNRQVVVFTHDVVFLDQLRGACEALNLSPSFCFLEANNGFYGNVSTGLPWAHKNYKERIDSLEKTQKQFEKLPWPTDPSEQLSGDMIRQYSFLRATIERVTQDFILNGAVQRFRDYIDVKRLEKVVGLEESEVAEILRLNQRCHDVTEAHDPSSVKNEPCPTCEEFRRDIADLKALIARIIDRRTAA